ncbi:hypothetical protein X946_4719 [Burkholderia sp. ABCPW 111]|nr:hypothetical protein X946_4719 [Burkholderia sp. ABCPW 111]
MTPRMRAAAGAAGPGGFGRARSPPRSSPAHPRIARSAHNACNARTVFDAAPRGYRPARRSRNIRRAARHALSCVSAHATQIKKTVRHPKVSHRYAPLAAA